MVPAALCPGWVWRGIRVGTVPLPGLSLAMEAVTVTRGYCPCRGGDDHPFPKARLTFCRNNAIFLHCPSPLEGSPAWLELCINPVPLCVQFPSFQQSQSNPTPRLPTPLMRTSPLNVKPEETPSPREYCLEKQTEAGFAFNLCQALLCLSGAAAQKPAHHPQQG